MTIKEKAEKLQNYCDKRDRCRECTLNSYKCGMFASWLDRNNLISDSDIEEAYNTVFGKEDENMFTKKDLIDGMVVKTREGVHYLVCGDLFIRNTGFLQIDTYNNDLTSKLFNEKDIVAVYNKIHSLDTLNDIEYNKKVLWKREEVKEMTIAEIEKELGYSIKIVKGKENE